MERTISKDGFLEDFKIGQSVLLERLRRAQRLFSEAAFARMREACSELQHKLESNTFNLVVMGEFKRGKSTFVNALLGAELLPAAVVPLTSAVTIVRYGATVRTTVRFLTGRSAEIDVTDIADYITERRNPENIKQVDRLIVEYPAEFLRDGVQLIDTPGVGSVFEHNTDTAYGFLPYADAVLFLVSADPPISEAELKFLSHIRQHAGKIFFIKNKIDHLSDEDLGESMAFTRLAIARDMQVSEESLNIFPISAKWALQGRLYGDEQKVRKSRLPELEKVVSEFLMREKGLLLLHNAQRRSLNVLGEAGGLLELEIRALVTPQEVLSEKMTAFKDHQVEVQLQKEEISHLLRGGVQRILQDYDAEVVLWKKKRIPELETALREKFVQLTRQNVKKLAAEMEQAVRDEIEAAFGPWRRQQEEKVDQAFRNLADRLRVRANGVIDRIYEIAGELFDLKLQRYERDDRLADEKYFYFKVGGERGALDPFENLLTYGVATLVSKKIILNKTLAELPSQFDRQCGRIRADLYDRLRESAFALQGRLADLIDEAYQEIQSLVQRAREQHSSNAHAVQERLDALQAARRAIGRLHREISELEFDGSLEAQPTWAAREVHRLL